jgi:hypothetical protein
VVRVGPAVRRQLVNAAARRARARWRRRAHRPRWASLGLLGAGRRGAPASGGRAARRSSCGLSSQMSLEVEGRDRTSAVLP